VPRSSHRKLMALATAFVTTSWKSSAGTKRGSLSTSLIQICSLSSP
jgi:hypothetical protein